MLQNLNAKRIFLIDALGALITATLLSQVLARLQTVFGMPRPILHILAAVALSFAIYSFVCYKIVKTNYATFLKGIAWANSLYCLITLGLVIYLHDTLTWLGIAYFIGEVMVVMTLVFFEMRIGWAAQSKRDTGQKV